MQAIRYIAAVVAGALAVLAGTLIGGGSEPAHGAGNSAVATQLKKVNANLVELQNRTGSSVFDRDTVLGELGIICKQLSQYATTCD